MPVKVLIERNQVGNGLVSELPIHGSPSHARLRRPGVAGRSAPGA
jgi:hypothetical protein